MKIICYVRDVRTHGAPSAGEAYGLLAPREGRFVPLEALPGLAGAAPREQLERLLCASPAERSALARHLPPEGEPLGSVRLRPPLPDCPLYLFLHGNCPTVWKRQGRRDRRWKMTRIPYPRVRPWTSLSGEGAEIPVMPNASLSHGAELGVVIGRPARRVPEEAAMEHVAGFLCQNDGFLRGPHDAFALPDPKRVTPYQRQALDTLSKAADGCGMMGPWITTREEVADPYDLVLRTYNDGRLQNRSWSGSYLLTIEYLIAYLSRFMTLPTGTVLGLGAAGWDGCPGDLPAEPGASRRLTVEIEGLGALNTTIRRTGVPAESPALAARRAAGLSGSRPPWAPRAVWVARGAHATSEEAEGVQRTSGLSPLLYPPGVLAESGQPLVLPPHATDVHLTVHLGAVIGPEPAYRVPRDSASAYIAGVVPMLGVRDASLAEPLHCPTAYELRAAWLLGGSGDGFLRMGPSWPADDADGFVSATVLLRAEGFGEAGFDFSGYRFSLAEMVEMVSRAGTLMPGDVLSLGQAGCSLVLPRDRRAPSVVEVVLDGEPLLRVPVLDERDPGARDAELR